MKPKSLTIRHLLLGAAAIGLTFLLASWGFRQQDRNRAKNELLKNDTISGKKVRNLDDAIAELDRVDWQKEVENAMKEVERAMKEIDGDKIKLEIEKAMKEVDMAKIKAEVDAAMREVDFLKIKEEIKAAMEEADLAGIEATVKSSLVAVDWENIQQEIKKVQEVDMKEVEREIARVSEEIKKIKPTLEKEMANAKVEIEKAKEILKEYKTFIDGLEKDGLISKKDGFTIRHRDGKLIINGKEADQKVYDKYRPFLDKHQKLNINQSEDDFDVDLD